jgi:ATP-dependent DNA helicase RecQ
LVSETTDGFPILKLNAQSWEVMKKQRSVMIAIAPKLNVQQIEDIDSRSESTQRGQALFEELRNLRKKLATVRSVPPYVIFADSTLRLMAQKRPTTLDALGQISGVGAFKLDEYGDAFVAAIRGYCDENPQENLTIQADANLESSAAELTNTHFRTLALIDRGLSAEAISEERGLRLTTVYGHLALLAKAGQLTDIDRFVDATVRSRVEAAIDQVGMDRLVPIFDALNGTVSYGEIRLVCAVRSAARREATELTESTD